MRKTLITICLMIISAVFVCGQDQDSDEEYNKNEFFAGYSYQNVGDIEFRENFNGANVSYVRNMSRHWGIKVDASGAYHNESFTFDGVNKDNGNYTIAVKNKRSLYNLMAGIQVKDNSTKSKFKPFAHALGGIGHNRNKISSNCSTGDCPPIILANRTFSDTGIAGAFGGGIDIKVNDKIDFRLIQVDYNPIFSGELVNHNVRVGIGIVFK